MCQGTKIFSSCLTVSRLLSSILSLHTCQFLFDIINQFIAVLATIRRHVSIDNQSLTSMLQSCGRSMSLSHLRAYSDRDRASLVLPWVLEGVRGLWPLILMATIMARFNGQMYTCSLIVSY